MIPRPVVSLTVIGTVTTDPEAPLTFARATVTGGVPVAVAVADAAPVGVFVGVFVAVLVVAVLVVELDTLAFGLLAAGSSHALKNKTSDRTLKTKVFIKSSPQRCMNETPLDGEEPDIMEFKQAVGPNLRSGSGRENLLTFPLFASFPLLDKL